MSDQSRHDSAPRFHIAILEDDGHDVDTRRTRLMLTPEGSAQEALGDLLKYASPNADPMIVSQHLAAILHGSVGVHLVGTWPPNVPAGGQSPTSDAYCSTCGQKVA
jgi:hypothetical protein